MTSTLDRTRQPFLLSALLLWALAAPGCESKSNPVLPSTGGTHPTGLVTGGSNDGGTTVDALAIGDASDVAGNDLTSDAIQVYCDMVKQDCTDKRNACYPVSGFGKCQLEGALSAQTACGFSGPNPDCTRGLTCVTTPTVGGTCLPLCDVQNPIPICGPGNVCHPLPGFTTVGYCQST